MVVVKLIDSWETTNLKCVTDGNEGSNNNNNKVEHLAAAAISSDGKGRMDDDKVRERQSRTGKGGST